MHIDHNHIGGHDHEHEHTHTHSHEHTHDGVTHTHEHDHAHTHEHAHPHEHDQLHHEGHEHHHCHGDCGHHHDHDHECGHHHDHEHECKGGCGDCKGHQEHTPMEELAALMKYMANHNAAHATELAQLAKQLEQAGNRVAYEQVMAAVSDFEKGNMRLSVVLSSLDIK